LINDVNYRIIFSQFHAMQTSTPLRAAKEHKNPKKSYKTDFPAMQAVNKKSPWWQNCWGGFL